MSGVPLAWPEAAAAIVDAGLRWSDERYAFAVHRRLAREADGAIATRLWDEIAALGWTTLLLPAAHAGLDADVVHAGAVAHVCGRSLLALPWLDHAVLATTALLACPQGRARDAALADLAQARCALAATEPGQRGAREAPSCIAREGRHGWHLMGEKAAVAAHAQRLLVTARVEGSGDLALLWIDAHAPGVFVRQQRGLDAHRIANVRLDTTVSTDALLALGVPAQQALDAAQDAGVQVACAEAVGLASLALDLTLGHLRTRVQFGQPIGRFQALQHRAADMFVALRYAAAITWSTLEDVAAAPRADHAAAAAAACAETFRRARIVLAGAMQLHGGMGMVDELPVSHAFKRLVGLERRFGDRPAQLERLAASVLAAA